MKKYNIQLLFAIIFICVLIVESNRERGRRFWDLLSVYLNFGICCADATANPFEFVQNQRNNALQTYITFTSD